MSRHLHACAYALLLTGIALGVTGLISDDNALARAGTLASIVAMTALCAAHTHRLKEAHRATDDQLADAHRAGYILALDHVARGLLDQPATPPTGHPHNLEDAPGVHRLHAVRTHHSNHQRQAG
ncbi:hypothetical protein ACOKM5_24405 [Streptomyces sp. BH097]|uniref:hypothetical protein n=1 Tax=Streptomyces sp. BH097 TaxID=3410406 RepID=UPI003CEE8BBD